MAKGLTGMENLAAEVPRQIANAHTIFNVANTVIFIGFTTQLARIVERLVPEKVEVEKAIIKPKFLDDDLIATPSLALDMVRLELGHLASISSTMLENIREAFQQRDSKKFDEIAKMDDQVDILHAELTDYLRKLTVQNLTEEENGELLRYLQANEHLERIGEVIKTNIVEVGQDAIRIGVTTTETARSILENLYDQVKHALMRSMFHPL